MNFFLPPPCPEGEDSISYTSGEELINSESSSLTSTAIKKKMDSLAGSTYGQTTSSIDEGEGRRRGKEWSRRWWAKTKSGFKQFLNYKIDQHGQCKASLLFGMQY
jgi:hypothetical protein